MRSHHVWLAPIGLALSAAALFGAQTAYACEPGVCYGDIIGAEATERPVMAPVFVNYSATPGSSPTSAEFVASGGANVTGMIEIFPSGEATEVSHHVVMVLPSTALTAGTTYNLQINTEAATCGEFAGFAFTAQAMSLPAPPSVTLTATDLHSEQVGPDPIGDCTDQNPVATRFTVDPQPNGDAPTLFALRVRDTYTADPSQSVYPELAIVDVRAALPLVYDAVADDTQTSARVICVTAAALSGDGQFGDESQEVCVTLDADGTPTPACPAGSDGCPESGCGDCAGSHASTSSLVWVLACAAAITWRRRR